MCINSRAARTRAIGRLEGHALPHKPHPPTQSVGRLEGHVSRRLLGLCSGDSVLDTAWYISTAQ